MGAFNVKISAFESFDSQPVDTTLARWIEVCRDGCKFDYQVMEYRQTGNPELKKSLPLATVGAVCQGGRKMENVSQRTGWIALDIDGKDNPHLPDAEALRDELKKIVFVAFAGLSVSGAGVWCLVKVSNPERQSDHFDQLVTDFASIGITLDSSKGRNANDARFYSYDPKLWHREDFREYDRLPKPKPKPRTIKRVSKSKDTRSDIEALIEQIRSQRIDITTGYDQWLKIGFALSDEFGESGRDMFHAISQYHPDYKEHETNRQFDNCIRSNGQGVTIASFFHLCRQYGIELTRDRKPQGKYESQISAPYGMNPYSGEIFDERGYPEDWDEIEEPETEGLNRLMQSDPMLEKIVELFDCELISEDN